MDEKIYSRMHEVEARHWWFSAKRRIILHLLRRYLPDVRAGGALRIADVGCGCGRFLEELSSFCNCSGFDASPVAVEFCLKRGLDVKPGSLPDDVPLEKGVFDAVILSDVIEHIDDDKSSVRAAAGLLKTGGVMVVTVPAVPALWSPWDVVHGHKRRYTKPALRKALGSTGLTVELLSHYSTLLFLPAVLGRKVVKRMAGSGSTAELAPPPEPINTLLRGIFACERYILGRIPLPVGLSLVAVLRKR